MHLSVAIFYFLKIKNKKVSKYHHRFYIQFFKSLIFIEIIKILFFFQEQKFNLNALIFSFSNNFHKLWIRNNKLGQIKRCFKYFLQDI